MAVLIIHARQGESHRPNVLEFACARRVTLTMSWLILNQLHKGGLRVSVLMWPENNMIKICIFPPFLSIFMPIKLAASPILWLLTLWHLWIVSQANNNPQRSPTVTSQRVQVPQKGRDVWQESSGVEADVGAADSSPAAGGLSWRSPCTHWQVGRRGGGALRRSPHCFHAVVFSLIKPPTLPQMCEMMTGRS